jgi:hypothetical protein
MMMKDTWEKIFEYASMPVHGTLSRKLRKNVSLQVNETTLFTSATIFLGENFVRITSEEDGMVTNVYYDWQHIGSMKTISPKDD